MIRIPIFNVWAPAIFVRLSFQSKIRLKLSKFSGVTESVV